MKILSQKQQILLNLMFEKNDISFFNQNVFSNKRTFLKSIEILLKAEFLNKTKEWYHFKYNLTVRGRLFVKLLKIFNNC